MYVFFAANYKSAYALLHTVLFAFFNCLPGRKGIFMLHSELISLKSHAARKLKIKKNAQKEHLFWHGGKPDAEQLNMGSIR